MDSRNICCMGNRSILNIKDNRSICCMDSNISMDSSMDRREVDSLILRVMMIRGEQEVSRIQ